jgi:hypothetical protein
MTIDEHAALRRCILDASCRAAHSDHNGINTSRPDDPT